MFPDISRHGFIFVWEKILCNLFFYWDTIGGVVADSVYRKRNRKSTKKRV